MMKTINSSIEEQNKGFLSFYQDCIGTEIHGERLLDISPDDKSGPLVISSVIDGFPFRAKALVNEQADISFCTYEKARNKYHQDIRQFGSDSAALM